MDIETVDKYRGEVIGTVKSHLSVVNIIIYVLMFAGLFGLGLLNWVDLSFDLDQIDMGYLIRLLLQVFSYGSIIASLSVYHLNKRKETSREVKDLERYNDWVIRNYRPDMLSEYVLNVNQKTKRELYLEKYKTLLSKLETKNNTYEKQNEWRSFKKKIEVSEDEVIDYPNEYCRLKYEYLDKISRVDELFEDEVIKFDKLTPNDLVVGITNNKRGYIPRRKESTDLNIGVASSATIMFIGSALFTASILNFSQGLVNGLVMTAITIFFVFISAIKGIFNGERVFTNTTLKKLKFIRFHLHGYAMYEATEHKYVLPDDEKV